MACECRQASETARSVTVADVVREYIPGASDELVWDILWNETGYPCFWHGDPEESLRMQVAKYVCREYLGEYGYFDSERDLRDLRVA